MIGLERMRDTLCFYSHHLVFRKLKKDKRTASGHSTSIVPSRDSESGRSHILFGYFSFIMLNLWLPQHPSFGNVSWYIAHSYNHSIITKIREILLNYLQCFPSKYIWNRKKKYKNVNLSLNLEIHLQDRG